MDVNKSFSEFNIISQRSSEAYLYFNELYNLSPLSNIPDLVENKDHY